MTELPEDRVYARHHRRRGAVLIVGAGAVGGFLAEELARIGCSPLWLVDPDVLAVENIVRHPLGAQAIGQPKASALAQKICRDLPTCDATGLDADYLELPIDEQLQLVNAADVVVAATDSADCQRRVNQNCLVAEVPAVYPAVWVDPRVRDAEVGELLWVLPGRHTPCYECWVSFRQASADAQAARGARVDIQLVALATAQVVAALLNPADERSAILDPQRTAIYVHGLTPTSPGIRASFPNTGLYSRNVRVPFPLAPCPACGGQDLSAADPSRVDAETLPQPHPPTTTAPAATGPSWDSTGHLRRRRFAQIFAAVAASAVLLVLAVAWLVSGPTTAGSQAGPSNQPAGTSGAGGAATSSARPAAGAPIPPSQTRLICDPRYTSSYANDGSDCTSGNLYSGDQVVLEVSGLTKSVVSALCQQGYHDEWSSRGDPWSKSANAQAYGGASGMCVELSNGMGFGDDGNLVASFGNPNKLGTDTVTWRLISPAGRTVLMASYSFRVLETLLQPLPTPPS